MSDSLLDTLLPVNNEPRRVQRTAGTGFEAHDDPTYSPGRERNEQISTRWASVCSLELQGFTHAQIAQRIGLHPHTISTISRDQRYIDYRNERLAELDGEFFSMKPLALSALRGGLTSNDENTALRASEQWFKAASFGGYSKTEAPATHLTAEDVARQLLGVQVNVTVNNVSEPPNTHPDSTIVDESVG